MARSDRVSWGRIPKVRCGCCVALALASSNDQGAIRHPRGQIDCHASQESRDIISDECFSHIGA
ncbi:hypothetical protein PybrP1_006065 [[Pythium] brassicae (nom. inval.)]|nr:hypothetical protein PybrP1_006065 [[Pythium] brassicae (nom. inval.)]